MSRGKNIGRVFLGLGLFSSSILWLSSLTRRQRVVFPSFDFHFIWFYLFILLFSFFVTSSFSPLFGWNGGSNQKFLSFLLWLFFFFCFALELYRFEDVDGVPLPRWNGPFICYSVSIDNLTGFWSSWFEIASLVDVEFFRAPFFDVSLAESMLVC